MEVSKRKIEMGFSEEEYMSTRWHCVTQENEYKVKILEIGDNELIGYFIIPDVVQGPIKIPTKWNLNGKVVETIDSFKDENCNIKMYRYEVLNYDNITSKDIPDDEKFEKEYKSYCEYANKMSKVEYLRYKQFCKDHRTCVSNNGAIGGGIEVSFMGTGLGNCVQCKCLNCGTVTSLTDIDSW